MTIKGGCLCGSVRYEVNGEFIETEHCHCSMCRKGAGAAFVTYASFNENAFKWVLGEELTTWYESSPGLGRIFCTRCGSTLAVIQNNIITDITLGTVDGDPEINIHCHTYVNSKAVWYKIDDTIKQFETKKLEE